MIFWATPLLQEHANWTQWSLGYSNAIEKPSVTGSFLYETSFEHHFLARIIVMLFLEKLIYLSSEAGIDNVKI